VTTRLITRAAIAAGAAALAVSAAAGPASAASYVDKQARGCSGNSGCAYGIAVGYWYKKGSAGRGVQWVNGTKETKSNKAFYARWLYQKPGGKLHVGKSWKKASDKGDFQQVNWWAGKHKGPVFPKGTKICTQFKGYSFKFCKTLA
jgi:hypothetical protein